MKENNTKILKIWLDKNGVDFFNKRKFKCQGVNMTDSIVVLPTGIIHAWYFVSSKELPEDIQTNYCEDGWKYGFVMKKSLKNLSEEVLY